MIQQPAERFNWLDVLAVPSDRVIRVNIANVRFLVRYPSLQILQRLPRGCTWFEVEFDWRIWGDWVAYYLAVRQPHSNASAVPLRLTNLHIFIAT